MLDVQWAQSSNGGWRIGQGVSSALLAEGTARTLPFGRILFRHLTDASSELSMDLEKEAERISQMYADIQGVMNVGQ